MKKIEFNDLSNGYNRFFDRTSYFTRVCEVECLQTNYFHSLINKDDFNEKMKNLGFVRIRDNEDYTSLSNDKFETFINYERKILVENKYVEKNITLLYERDGSTILELKAWFLENKPVYERKGKINFLVFSNNQFDLIELDNKKVDVDFEADYECNFNLNELKEIMDSDKTGLLLLTSKTPGTGKSYLIRHLCNQITKKFVFLPNQVLANLSNPDFLGFALQELKDSILIAEDAETCLIDRQKGTNDAASTLLNITDGIIGDALKLKVICTINNDEQIDRALLRKGRLLAKIDFKPLSIEKSNKFLEKRGIIMNVKEPHSLADLYNVEQKGAEKELKTPIGFQI